MLDPVFNREDGESMLIDKGEEYGRRGAFLLFDHQSRGYESWCVSTERSA